ncbi:hypothetical protein SFRURICE_001093 [Spodoptera frugiperda]|nr:hypothetical protein SFRURICE_001093 [Spodoptera frugiperda]
MSSQQLIANELLAFIQNAIDTMDEVSIMQICKSNFKEDEISKGKMLLFQTTGKLDQMPSRRRDGTDKSVQDIITFMKATDPDDVPTFVAKELHKLPPVTFDHVDVTRLLKDITSLKSSLAQMQCKLESSDATIQELRAEIVLLRNAVSESRSQDEANVNTRRGAQNVSVSSFASAKLNSSPSANNEVDAPCPAAPRVSPRAENTCTDTTFLPLVSEHPSPPGVYPTRSPIDNANTCRKQPKRGKQNRRCESVSRIPVQRCPGKPECDEDGFIKVQKKKKKPTSRNQCGTGLTGPNMLLRPAVPTTLLYVSRLHHTTKVEDIVEYVKVKTNWTLRVVRLEPRQNTNFKSFVVRVPTQHLDKFLKAEFWPKGVIYRRFRGRLRDTEQRNTTPRIVTSCDLNN